ncbi:hypothetical protein FB45DRAFT_842418 [Roridomyces roridus]|uniref:GH18 domain-containing protein n=1 Tax=Roridomyces roridus TaxID=1738132 RepID=A0AAD7BA34_9AGAR|nr:hypothetical protein FB45DRAFT_842418 [Roridomyces roridus]
MALTKRIGYYEGWAAARSCDAWSPSNINVASLTHGTRRRSARINSFTHRCAVNFAFAYISSSFEVVEMTAGDSQLWTETTALKSQNPTLKVFLSIGGWTFNNPPTAGIFSGLVGSEANTNVFIKSVLGVMNAYGFDGIDIDWEYPVAEDRGGAKGDKENYVTFIKAVKTAFIPFDYELSFTAPTSYWYLQNYDLPGMLADGAADWVNVMTYDLHGVWDSPADYIGSIVLAHTNLTEIMDAFQLYANVGIDPTKMVMGIGFYGRSFELVSDQCTTPGCPFAGAAPAGPCSANAGTLMFTEIEDIISSVGTNALVFDEEAAVKYLVYNDIDWVSYDDQQTLGMKLQYANSICLIGTMIWSHGTPPNCLDNACPIGQTVIYNDNQGDASSSCVGNDRKFCCDTPNDDTFLPIPPLDVFPESEIDGNVITFTVDFDDNQGTPDITQTGAGSSGIDDDGQEETSPFASVFISSPNAASVSSLDLESDWAITNCDPTSDQSQSVLAYCTCPIEDEDCGCGHVFIGQANDTIVKLPDTCGLGPYARVVLLEPHPDQTVLSADHAARKRSTDPVYSLVFDYLFTDIAEENGPVYMRADMTDIHDYWNSIVDSTPDSTIDPLRKRDLNFHSPRGVEKRWTGSFANWLSKLNTITNSNSIARNYHWSDTYTIFHQEEASSNLCPCCVQRSDWFAQVNSMFGYYLEAKIVPPSIQQAYVYFKAGAGAEAAFTITGVASASWDSGRYELMNFGFPGLYYPGLLTLGPSLHLYGELSGELSLSGTYKTSVMYNFPSLDLSFGKQDSNPGQSNFGQAVQPTNNFGTVDYNVGWNVELTGSADVHLIPSLQLGISILGGSLLDGQVFVEADLFAGLSITGSVSDTVAPNFCVTPVYGVNLNAGLTGSVLFWEPGPVSTTFYSVQSDLGSGCFNSIDEPTAADSSSSKKRTSLEAFAGQPLAYSASVGERFSLEPPARTVRPTKELLREGYFIPTLNNTDIGAYHSEEEALHHTLSRRAKDGASLMNCPGMAIPIAAYKSLNVNGYYDLASPMTLSGNLRGYSIPPYYTGTTWASPAVHYTFYSHGAVIYGREHVYVDSSASLFIDYLKQFPNVWTDGSGDNFCDWVSHNLSVFFLHPSYMPAGTMPVSTQIGNCYPSRQNSLSAGIPVLEQRAKCVLSLPLPPGFRH